PRPLVDAAIALEKGVEAVVDRQPHLQLDRADVVEDRLHASAVLGHPLRDLAVVADRGRQSDELDGARRLDDDLLPHRAAREVVEVVDLVQDHVAHQVEAAGIFVDQVAEDLGRHPYYRGVVVDRVLAGDEPHGGIAVRAHEVVVLLVAERFERGRVQDLGPLLEGAEDGVLGDDGLAARGGRADEHASAPTVELLDRRALEGVEAKRQSRLEFLDERADGLLHSGRSSVETSATWAPPACPSTYESAAASTRSACRLSALTVTIAISASCQRSSSPTSAAATFNSCRSRCSSPLTTWRLDLREPDSGR